MCNEYDRDTHAYIRWKREHHENDAHKDVQDMDKRDEEINDRSAKTRGIYIGHRCIELVLVRDHEEDCNGV